MVLMKNNLFPSFISSATETTGKGSILQKGTREGEGLIHVFGEDR